MSLRARVRAAWRALNGYHLQQWSPDRPYLVPQSQSARLDIPYGVRRSIVSWGREFERKDPVFNRYLDLCEQYIVGPSGLRIVSGSTDKGFADRANNEWQTWEPYADLGSRFSFGQLQSVIVREERVVGEVFVLLTTGESGRPRIQLIPTEEIETPPKLQGDASVVDGIRYDIRGRPVSYFRKSGTAYAELPAESVVHIYEPSRIGQGRGLSVLYPSLKDAVDLNQLQDYEMLAAKDAARVSKIIETESGELDTKSLRRTALGLSSSNGNGVEQKTAAEYYQQAFGAETHVIKRGDKYAQFESNRPSVAMQGFWDFVTSRYCAGLGIPVEIILLRAMQGTVTRAALDMANGFFRSRSAMFAEHFGRIWEHVIGRTITGAKPGDWRKTRYTPPRSINVDVGRNSAAMISEWQAGFRTLEDIAGELGKDWRDIMRQRAEEFAYAQQVEADAGLPPGSVITVPNQAPATPQNQPA